MTGEERLRAFVHERPYLFAVAYRMLGSAEDADDILQDAWLRFESAGLETLVNPRAYLVTIVSRLALDQVRSARRRREAYAGPWLPEPVPTAQLLPEDLAERAESASFAFLLLLERLNPLERVALVLHEVFDYSHDEIAAMTARTPAASRQTLRRARLKLGESRPPRPVVIDTAVVTGLVPAMRAGDVGRLMTLLAPDVVLVADGGGKAPAIGRPLVGRHAVARFLVAMAAMEPGARVDVAAINGSTALLAYLRGTLVSVFVFESTAAGVTAIHVVRNPDKLRRLQR